MEPIAVGIADAVKLTGVSRDVLYRLMSAGKLRFNQIGARRLIDYAHLKEVVLDKPISTEELNVKQGEEA